MKIINILDLILKDKGKVKHYDRKNEKTIKSTCRFGR